jgi:hypothetical protein
LPLTTLLEKLHALVTLQDAALGTDTAGLLEAGVLRHDWKVVKLGVSGSVGRNDEIARGESLRKCQILGMPDPFALGI